MRSSLNTCSCQGLFLSERHMLSRSNFPKIHSGENRHTVKSILLAVKMNHRHSPLRVPTLFSLKLYFRLLLDDLHQCFLFAILQSPFRDCDYKSESFEARERTDKRRAFLLRTPPPIWLHSPVHLERAQVLTQKTELEIVNCIMISNSIYIERGQQTLTSNVDCIQLVGKVEWPGVHDASIHWRHPTP